MDALLSPAVDATQKRRLRVASFSTSAFFARALESALRDASCDATVACAEFGGVMAELLSSPGEAIDALLVLLDEKGLPARDWRQSSQDASSRYESWLEMLIGAMDRFARGNNAALIVNTVPGPATPAVGHLDFVHADGQLFRIAKLNQRLRDLAAGNDRIQLVESEAALADIAPTKRTDAKLWFYGRIPYSAAADTALANAFAAVISERGRPRPKVLALDLDDTLWRGLYGERGAFGVECGDDFPGNAYKALQEECLRLKSQGILLTILSKNDPDALEVFDKHPGMLLRRSDFVATRINWSPKADNIRELSAELGLSLDTFLFLDDSPHEREAMRRLATEVRVLDLPVDPAARPQLLRSYRQLWPLRLTDEDTSRTEMYAARRDAQAAATKAVDMAEYLKSLEQRLVVEPVSSGGLARIAQMHERTNQFNLTTRRLSQAELSAMMAEPQDYVLLQGSVSDRFGDHGVVICAIANIAGTRARLISLLMSCRVIGREVEHAFLGAMIERLRGRGVDHIEIPFIPTERNEPAATFVRNIGLTRTSAANADGELWLWHSDQNPMPGSAVVDVRT